MNSAEDIENLTEVGVVTSRDASNGTRSHLIVVDGKADTVEQSCDDSISQTVVISDDRPVTGEETCETGVVVGSDPVVVDETSDTKAVLLLKLKSRLELLEKSVTGRETCESGVVVDSGADVIDKTSDTKALLLLKLKSQLKLLEKSTFFCEDCNVSYETRSVNAGID